MTKLELAMLAGAYAIKNSRFGKNDGGFVKGVFSPNPEEIRFSEAAEILCETVDEQNVFTCPVKLNMRVYHITEAGIEEEFVEAVRFSDDGWQFYCEGNVTLGLDTIYPSMWMTTVFPTREAAENRLAEMRGDADGK